MMSSLISFVLVWRPMMDFSRMFCLSKTLALSPSSLLASFSVWPIELLSIENCSSSLLLSFMMSVCLSLRNSSSPLIFCRLAERSSDVSCSFLVSFLTPLISDSIWRMSSCFCLMSSLIAWRALSLYCMPKRDFCQSSNKVFLDMMIFSISMAASLRVFLAAAVSSFWEISWAW